MIERLRQVGRRVALGVLFAVAASLGQSGCGYAPASDRQTLILVSLDGFAWDFRSLAETPHLDALAKRGVSAERLVPIFPSKTFPNHYTIVTGLYAEHHGIVANSMYDPELDAHFSLSDRDAVTDPRWWGGEPIWVTAELQGVRTAAYFWPGTEVAIKGVRPTRWRPYDGSVPNTARVDTVLMWLDLPPVERPRLVTLYFSLVDDVAHRYPRESEQVRAAIREADSLLGRLLEGIAERGLTERVNVVVVSDHGMAPTSRERAIVMDDYIDLASVEVVDWNPVLALWPHPGQEAAVYAALRGAHPHLAVYRRAEIPERYHYRDNPRIPPIIAVADTGWSITSRDYLARFPERLDGNDHGYDPSTPAMGALFIAAGPAFKSGLVVPPFSNVHLYELFCAVLGLEPAPNDGSLDSVRVMLK